jgi:hypothetical protein
MLELARAKRDDLAFGEMIGQPLAPWQRVELSKPVTAVVGARGIGKSRLIAIKALRMAVAKRGVHVLLASSSEDGSKRLIARCRDSAQGSPALQASFEDEQLGLLRFRNGSIIRAIATSEISARGWVVDAVLLDESQLLSRDFVDALLPTLSATGGKVLLCGTAGVAEGPFYDLAKAGEVGSEYVETVRWVPTLLGGRHDAPWLSASVIEAARESMSAQRFAAEYLAEFGSGSDAVFPLPVLQAATCDFQTTPLAEFQPAARISAGVDWGERADRSCLVGVARFAGQSVFAPAVVRRWKSGASLPALIEEIAATPACVQAWWSERNGIGASASQHLWAAVARRPGEVGGGRRRSRVVVVEEGLFREFPPPRRRAAGPGFVSEKYSVFTNAELKAAIFGTMRIGLEQGWLILPAGETELLSELLHLKSEITMTGERISGSPHDDLAMAFLMAMAPIADSQRGWRCKVAELARGHVPPVALSPELARIPTVSAPTGAQVPRTPAWQSLLGGEVTLPTNLDLTPPEPPQIRKARKRVAEALQRQREEATNG